MPRADEYAGAADALDAAAKEAHTIALERPGQAAQIATELAHEYTLAARCVRAMAAWAAGEIDMWRGGTGGWVARALGSNRLHYAIDPLDAITAALGGDDGKA